MLSLADAQKLHAALHDALGRVAVARHDAVRERPVVHADANGRLVLAAEVEERHQPSLDFLQFLGIFLVRVVDFVEFPRRIDVISGVDAHLVGIACGHVGHVRVEMHVGHDGRVIASPHQLCLDVAQVFRLARALRGEAHEFASGLDDSNRLSHSVFRV